MRNPRNVPLWHITRWAAARACPKMGIKKKPLFKRMDNDRRAQLLGCCLSCNRMCSKCDTFVAT